MSTPTDRLDSAVLPDDDGMDEELLAQDQERYDAFDEEPYEEPERSSDALFSGDTGVLELPQRKAFLALLKRRFISARGEPKEWQALIDNPAPIRSRLNDLFLELAMDPVREVAYKRQVTPEGGGRFPTLLHDLPWGREDTLLMVFLRDRTRGEQAAGNDVTFVDREDMLEAVAAFRPAGANDQFGDAKRVTKSIENLVRAGLLIGRSDADRYEVSTALEVLMPVDMIHELTSWLREQNSSSGTDQSGTAAGDDDDGTVHDDSTDEAPEVTTSADESEQR